MKCNEYKHRLVEIIKKHSPDDMNLELNKIEY
jgi:hypothetical protein